MNPFDFSDVADNTTDELHDLLREYILTSSSELHGELVTTRRTRQYIGTGQIVEVTEIEAVQYGTVIQTHDAFVETDAGTALLTYLVETHDFEPSTPYLTNLLRYAFEELDAVTVSETETGDENVQELHVTVTDDESLRGIVDECVQTVTADINEQHQYTLRLALSGAVVENGVVEINDTHRLRGVDDGLLLGEKRVSNTAPETKRGKNVKSWSAVAEIDISTNHAFSGAPDVAAEFLAVTLSVFSQSWIAVKNHHIVPRTFHIQMPGFPAPGENGASLAEIEPQHATQPTRYSNYCARIATGQQHSSNRIRTSSRSSSHRQSTLRCTTAVKRSSGPGYRKAASDACCSASKHCTSNTRKERHHLVMSHGTLHSRSGKQPVVMLTRRRS